MLKLEEGVAMATQPGFMHSVRSSMCFQSLLGFFFNKGVRGGPRVLLNLAAVLFALFIFVRLLPERMTESALQSIPMPQSIWSSLGAESGNSLHGGLRIVVFGEIDIGTPVGADEEVQGSKTWTEALCDQLACDHHISMVPPPDVASWSISSNEIYAQGVEKVFNETADKDSPGQDYSYLSTAYPPQWKSSDLREQVDKFLAMPKPRNTPGSTLWVFSFGLWDVWSLSALPISTGRDAVEAMTKDIFEQIERLHAASTDPKSMAYSDVNNFIQKTANDTAEKVEDAENEEEASAGEQLETTEEMEPESQPATQQETKPLDKFSILIPRILDPSLLPGWRSLRAQIPSVHSKAEQMRNSAALTGAWNDGIVNSLSDWVKKDEPKTSQDDQSNDFHFETVAPGTATGPLRDGFAYNLADFVTEQILERQMLNAHLTDGNGRGQGELEDGYRDVHNACLQPVSTVAVALATPSSVMVNIPNVKVEGDKQVPAQPSTGEGDKAKDNEKTARRDTGDEKAGLAYLSTARVCDIPSDHLFYTPFALSQRAIQEVAAETAEMIRKGESVRARLGW